LRTSLWSTLIVIALAVLIGAIVGTIAGATGGWVDAVLMRVTDLFLAMPGTLLAIAVVAAYGASLRHTLLAVTAVWWPWYARIVRNEVWALSARPHLEAARLAGIGPWRRALRHLLPGVTGPVLVTAALDTGALLVTLSGLSFFGLGAPPPHPELGSMTARGINYLLEFWWIPILPALGVALLAFVANLVGEAARSRLEPG
jgi:peptide/nickel transport system permease protein